MSMPLTIYNSLSKKKEIFEPINPPYVGMYVCGPTVSGESHLGHARPYITFDVVYRYLLYLGYKVRYVRNITDAGHFEEEGREAIDKISTKAQLERMEPMELVHKYTNLFHWAFKKFNTLVPNIEPTATGHIVEQIDMIKKLLADGYAYEVNGSVYFDVKKYAENHDYGKLSGRVIEDLLETTRDLEGQEEKRNKVDFALWKAAPPKHIMRWNSPWGEGFPGWHIECSAMATKYLGAHFDIHGGGMDLLFPHHESEIAQSTICNHIEPAKYWMHNNMITVAGKKMGKSYNNQIKLTEMFDGSHPLLTQPFSPMTIRFFILQTHYKSTLDFSSEALVASEKGLKRLLDAARFLKMLPVHTQDGVNTDKELNEKIQRLVSAFPDFINDDFNTAKVLANMFELVPIINSIKDGLIEPGSISSTTLQSLKEEMDIYLTQILGIEDELAPDVQIEQIMELLIEIRKEARDKKDFATSDKIRKKLEAMDIVLNDEKGGKTTWNEK
ncbi:MAG: cysteine--tRNA ligase [Bacteroidetes bacterium]|nr:cysteine--tRNA ligase [Bacteroidota bacterium]